jgi:GTP 3',8-cyclase
MTTNNRRPPTNASTRRKRLSSRAQRSAAEGPDTPASPRIPTPATNQTPSQTAHPEDLEGQTSPRKNPSPNPATNSALTPAPLDTLNRPLHDLRISVTDRCNFRCPYCMPKEVFGRAYKFLPKDELLTFEEIARLTRIFAAHGVEKVRLTGGEPTLRRGLPHLVEMLAGIDGVRDLAMTTNGSRLAEMARDLQAAGLQRVTVSLDSLDDATFRAMNDAGFPVALVLDGIEAAHAAGLSPIKINAVIKRGVNEDSIVDLARRFRGPDYIVRFIEYMDVGTTNGWRLDDVVPAREIIERIDQALPIEPADPNYRGEVARRWRYKDGSSEIGVIASVTQPFCGDCTRARLSADGKLYTCLFAFRGHDFRVALRSGASDDQLASLLTSIWRKRADRYSERRTASTSRDRIEMSYIGG